MSPSHPEQKTAPPPTRSLTADFFATPLRTPSPPKTMTTTAIRQRTIETHLPTPYPLPAPPPALPRLPLTAIQGPNFESPSSELTPHPPDLEPTTLLHFERSLLLADQESQKRNRQPQSVPESELISADDGEMEEEPHTGSIISLNTEHHPIPRFSLSPLGLTFTNSSLQGDHGTPMSTSEPSSSPSKPTTLPAFSSSLPTSPSTWDNFKSTPTLRLLHPLAHGAFSIVWLAEDLSRLPLTLVSKKSVRDLRRVSGRYKERRERERGREIEILKDEEERHVHLGRNLPRHSTLRSDTGTNCRLVAVKMTPRKVRGAKGKREKEEEERTRAGFVREVEVLKHISHPNITPLLAHLSISTHHILVLPYLSGGDLLGLVNNDVAWGKLGESVLKRIWCELCKAVGWMHGVGLVHRDIKLENILLTTRTFNSLTPTSPPPTSSCLPIPPSPFIKLTDFGLSRFVEIDVNGEAELLWTRCGSEAYAAPELVTDGGGGSGGGGGSEGEGGESSRRGVYDARKTDAWACGVVLYALVARRLPFGEGVGAQPIGGSQIGEEQSAGRGSLAERRHWLMRIARGEYEWPGDQGEGAEESQLDVEVEKEREKDELVGSGLIHSQGARRIVGRLLIRDPRKRARIGDLWDDSWMALSSGGDEVWWKAKEERELYDSCFFSMMTRKTTMEGSLQDYGLGHEDGHEAESCLGVHGRTVFDHAEAGVDSLRDLDDGEEGENGEEEEEDGCLFDHEGIDSITRQEVV